MRHLSIGEVAEREGLSPEALRSYERLGLVFPVGRTRSGYRLYDVETLRRLRFIRMARELGSSVEEIRELLRSRRQRYAAGCNSAWGKLTTMRWKRAQLHHLGAAYVLRCKFAHVL
jgi:DNA-binding transcriptional MerR regulator